MSRNVELKARYDDLDAGHLTAQRISATLHAVERQRDTYFRAASGRLKLRERWPLDPTGAPTSATPSQLIWYHRADEALARASDYTLVAVSDGERLREVLAGSVGVLTTVEKRRTVYLHDNVRIHLDSVAGLGSFLEFEAIVDSSCDDTRAHEKVARLITAFEVRPAAIVAESYSDLLRR
jgi:adenylate cyclase class IV